MIDQFTKSSKEKIMSLPLACRILMQVNPARAALPDAPVIPDPPVRRSFFCRISESIQRMRSGRSPQSADHSSAPEVSL